MASVAGCARSGFWTPHPRTADAGADAGCTGLTRSQVLGDLVPPSLHVISPGAATAVSGTIEVCAEATDSVHVVGVRFWVDGAQLGAEDSVAPYCHSLDSRRLADGEHQLIARARDGATNTTAAQQVFTIDNGRVPGGDIHFACDCAAGADSDCVPGADAADGLAPQRAVQSTAAAQQVLANLHCGDELRFCLGGAFEPSASYVVPSVDCSGTPVHLGAYRAAWASGDEKRPRLVLSGNNDGLVIHGSSGVVRGLVVEDLHLICPDCTRRGSGWGLAVTGAAVRDVVLQRLEVEGFDYGLYLSAAANILVEYVSFHHSHSAGIVAGGPGLRLRHNLLEYNGCIGAVDDDSCADDWSLFVGYSFDGSVLEIIGNEITRTAVDSQGLCRGVALRINGGSYGARVEGNYLHEPQDGIREGCSGIEALANPDGILEFCVGCSISGNRIENLAAGIVVSAHDGSQVASNTVALPPNAASWTSCAGITVLQRLEEADAETSAIAVVNNSIAIGRDDPGCTGVRVAAEGVDHVVANNAVQYTGLADSFDCFRYGDPAVLLRADHNLCELSPGAGGSWAAVGTSRYPLDAWQARGHDAASTAEAVGFAGAFAPLYDLSPLSCDQGMRDHGSNLDCPDLDVTGATRPQGSACDIGAHER
ncbi:MAG: Ig-like domain-containing protein [Pseudomonadota bacterium]